MKLSELIEQLQSEQDKQGNVAVYIELNLERYGERPIGAVKFVSKKNPGLGDREPLPNRVVISWE